MRCEKGHQMSTVIGVGLWQVSCECGVFTVSLSGKNCSLSLIPVAADKCACGNPKSLGSPCCAECIQDKKDALAAKP